VLASPLPEPGETPAWEQIADLLTSHAGPEALDACQFTFESSQVRCSKQFAEYAKVSFGAGTSLLVAALDLTSRIHRDFKYDTKATKVSTPLEKVFEERR